MKINVYENTTTLSLYNRDRAHCNFIIFIQFNIITHGLLLIVIRSHEQKKFFIVAQKTLQIIVIIKYKVLCQTLKIFASMEIISKIKGLVRP